MFTFVYKCPDIDSVVFLMAYRNSKTPTRVHAKPEIAKSEM